LRNCSRNSRRSKSGFPVGGMSGQDKAGDEAADRILVMGHVAAPYGVKGWLRVMPCTERLDSLLDYPSWYLRAAGGDWRKIGLVQGRVHGKGLAVQLEGCNDRDTAGIFAGAEIGIYRSQLPAAGTDEFYWSDLAGLKVVTVTGRLLGQVDHLFETGSNDVLVVRGEQEYLVPYITGQVVKSVDLAAGEIRVDWDPDF
jgi:16S rRNA processing protein RimM